MLLSSCLKDPAAACVLSNKGESSLDFTLRVWCKNVDYWDVYNALAEATKYAFDENDVTKEGFYVFKREYAKLNTAEVRTIGDRVELYENDTKDEKEATCDTKINVETVFCCLILSIIPLRIQSWYNIELS